MTAPEVSPELVLWRANRGAYLLVWSLCRTSRFSEFACVYAWFRWLDDELDQPGIGAEEGVALVDQASAFGADPRSTPEGFRDPLAAVAARAALLGAAASGDPEVMGIVAAMTAGLRGEVGSRGEPRNAAEIDGHCESIGDAYLRALWRASEGEGPIPADLFWLARAATGAHLLRDLHEDHDLGRTAIPSEELASVTAPDGRLDEGRLETWRRRRAQQLLAWFARGRGPLARVRPWRAWALIAAFAWKYERLARRWG